MKVALLGTCRVSFIRKHYSCTDFDDAISFVHSTKEILQLLRFITKQVKIPDPVNRVCFRTSIINRRPVEYSDKFLEQFDEADLFVIEISSMTKYLYQGYYLHHLAVDKRFHFYLESPTLVLRDTKVEYQQAEEISNDIDEIVRFVQPRKVLIVSHINAAINDDASERLGPLRRFFSFRSSIPQRQITGPKLVVLERRSELIQLLRTITREKEIPFFDPSVILKNYRQKRIIQKEEPGLPPSHYTEFGGKIVGRLYAAEIKKIMGNS